MKERPARVIIFLIFSVVLICCSKKEGFNKITPDEQDRQKTRGSQKRKSSDMNNDKLDHLAKEQDLMMPGQRYPDLITSPAVPNPVGERLAKIFSDIDPNDKEYVSRIKKLWNESVQEISDKPLDSATTNVEIANGVLLPTEMTNPKEEDFTKDTPAVNLKCIALLSLAPQHDNLLGEFAKQRANSLPPTQADLAIYQAIDAAIREFSLSHGQALHSSFEQWEPFAKSSNPLFRLLALKAARKAVSKPAWDVNVDSDEFGRINEIPKLSFYRNFLDEKEPEFWGPALYAMSLVPHSDARNAIEQFHDEHLKKGDTMLIEAAERALHTNQLILDK